jgi:hypothetical protein
MTTDLPPSPANRYYPLWIDQRIWDRLDEAARVALSNAYEEFKRDMEGAGEDPNSWRPDWFCVCL